jgi:hypothetical protein
MRKIQPMPGSPSLFHRPSGLLLCARSKVLRPTARTATAISWPGYVARWWTELPELQVSSGGAACGDGKVTGFEPSALSGELTAILEFQHSGAVGRDSGKFSGRRVSCQIGRPSDPSLSRSVFYRAGSSASIRSISDSVM